MRIPDAVKYFIAVFILIFAAILFVLGTLWLAVTYFGGIGMIVWTAFMFSVFTAASASVDLQ